jgi:cell division protease FtsH
MSDEERRIVAYHESGHALVALALPHATPPHKLTILPRANTLGHVRTLDTHDRVVSTRSMMIDEMAAFLGGKMAEELIFGEAGSGCSADLEHVGRVARRMVRQFGMSEALGSVAYPDREQDWRRPPPSYSEESARTIDAEVRRLVTEASERASLVLTASRPALDAVATALLERETLTAADLEALAGSHRVRPETVPPALDANGTPRSRRRRS